MAAPTSSSTGHAASWDTQGDASDTHLAEPNVLYSTNGTPKNPTLNPNPRNGVPGLRAVLGSLVRTGIPRLPLGPPKAARMGQGYNRSSLATPKPISKVQQFVPAPSAEQAGNWYDSFDDYR